MHPWRTILLAGVALSLGTAGLAMLANAPPMVPIDRLIKNTEAYLAAHPVDPEGHYVLARAHYLAFAKGLTTVAVTKTPGGLEKPWDDLSGDRRREARADEAARLTKAETSASSSSSDQRVRYLKNLNQLEAQSWPPVTDAEGFLRHAEAGLREFKLAIALGVAKAAIAGGEPRDGHPADSGSRNNADADKIDPLYQLGLACLERQYLDLKKTITTPLPAIDTPLLGAVTEAQTLADTWRAYRLATVGMPAGDGTLSATPKAFICYEAGMMLVEASRKDPAALTAAQIDEVKAQIARAPQKISMISPIIFSLDQGDGLDALLTPNSAVSFDLDGTGRAQRWPWVRPDTAILVWDPDNKGHITSGRQLFGNATWWMLFSDGYRALDALDDNRDGKLSGAELKGLAAWFDRNGDGVSDPGEVVPLERLGVAAIAVHANGKAPTSADGSRPAALMNPDGVTLRDGRSFPTYDWVAKPHAIQAKINQH